MNFILGSSSPRRLELLKSIGINPDKVVSPDIDEKINKNESPLEYSKRISFEKINSLKNSFPKNVLLTADTVAYCGKRLIDKTSKVEVAKGYDCVSHRGYVNNILHFNDCRIPARNILGEKDKGFELMNVWLEATRLTVAATSVSRAERAFDIALDWSANRKQFGKVIGKFQGVSFKLADMATEIKLANLMLMELAWKIDQKTLTSQDAAMTKLFCTEMLSRVSDEAIQICGGMGLMADIPLERIWRDARIERIWEGTSEIQRHIISRSLLRPLGA